MQMIPFKQVRDAETKERVFEVSLRGQMLLDHALLNKGSAFTEEERRSFGLLGLLPPHVSTFEEQLERNFANFTRNSSDLERYVNLVALQDRNETLFYRLLHENIELMLPIIYTPVVGAASQHYSHIYRRPRGLYIDYPHRDEIDDMLSYAPNDEVAVIVVTDGERVLGLGDLGIGGMNIPVGKLALYTLCAGIHPATTLPILLDVGTDNQELLSDPLYLGWRHERIRGAAYDEFVESFVSAVMRKFPRVLLQWEDFARQNARRLLDRYADRLCTFNDDIQGTGAVTLAGLLAALKAIGEKLEDQRIVMFGAGSAATGIAEQIVSAMVSNGLSVREARARLWLIDIGGLVHDGRKDLEDISRSYAQPLERISDWTLANAPLVDLKDVVHNLRPTVLLGLSAQPGAFTQEVVEEMAHHATRPIIFPLSNPTSRAEATPIDLLKWTSGRAIVATGSPYADVPAINGKRSIGQCNNAYVFPGVGLGVLASGARRVRQEMFMAAARALAEISPALRDSTASLFQPLSARPGGRKACGIRCRHLGSGTGRGRIDAQRRTRTPYRKPHVAANLRRLSRSVIAPFPLSQISMRTSVIKYRVADFLKRYAPFSEMSDLDLLDLASSGRVVFHESEEFVFQKDEERGPFVWVIQQGRVHLLAGNDGEDQLKDILGEGDIPSVGPYSRESTLPLHREDGERCHSSIPIDGDTFENLARRNPKVSKYLAAHFSLSERYAESNRDEDRLI
jgi:malate dehydrogenase (oxaloacetate-decarboxylating)